MARPTKGEGGNARLNRRFTTFRTWSELQTALADHIRDLGQALGLTRAEFSKRLGVSKHTLDRILDKGYPFNHEFAMRLVKVSEGFTFEKAPALSHKLRNNRDLVHVETYLEKPLYAKFEKICQAENCAPSVVAYNYMRMGIEGIKATLTWTQAYESARQAVLAMMLRESPWLQYVMEMDLSVAKAEAVLNTGRTARKPTPYPDDLPLDLPSSHVVRELNKTRAMRESGANPMPEGESVEIVVDWLDEWKDREV